MSEFLKAANKILDDTLNELKVDLLTAYRENPMAKMNVKTATTNQWSGTVGGSNVTIVAIDIENEEYVYITTAGATVKGAWGSVTVTESSIVPS